MNTSNCSRVTNRVQDCAWALPWTRRVRLAATPDGMATRFSWGRREACVGPSSACFSVNDVMLMLMLFWSVMVCFLQTQTLRDACFSREGNDGDVAARYQWLLHS